jgi:rhomboid family GlyGly-CTERM serine protease
VTCWKARRIPCASLLLSAAAAIVFFCPSLAAELQYDRGAIAAGEWWRLVSGHWAHYGADHFFWDVLAFGALGLACEQRSRCRFLVCMTASAVAVSLSVWLWLPGMSGYRGLSGIDSALFALLFVEFWSEMVRSGERHSVVFLGGCLAVFLFKIVFELTTGTNLFVKTLESGPVGVPLAHITGATVGFLVGLGAVNRRILCAFIHKTSPWRIPRRPVNEAAGVPGRVTSSRKSVSTV